jgi:peroxiredoxin
MGRVKKGDRIADFVINNQDDLEVNTEGFEDKKILLSFHPLAWTSVCAKQMQSLEKNYEKFEELNTIPLGVSVDTAPSKKAWAESLGIKNLDLLCDFWPHGKLAGKLGIFLEKYGFSERANIILNEDRKAVFVKIYPMSQLPDVNEVIDFLEKNKKQEE